MDFNSADKQLTDLLKRKRRRNSSAKKGTSTMHFTLDSNKKILPTLQDNKDKEEVIYCDKVLKVHTKFELVSFQIVITKLNIYLFKDSSGNLKRKVSLHTIDSVCLSHQSDNFLLIRLKNGGDLLLVSPNKIQIVRILAQNWVRSSAFPLSVTDRFRYRIDEKLIYAIIFTRSDFGVEMAIYHDKNAPAQETKKSSKK